MDWTIAFWVKTTASAGTGQWWAGKGLVDGEVGGVQDDFGTALVGNQRRLWRRQPGYHHHLDDCD